MILAKDALLGKQYLSPKNVRVTVVTKDPKQNQVFLRWESPGLAGGLVRASGDLKLTKIKK